MLQQTSINSIPNIKVPRANSKQAKLVAMWSRKSGITFAQASKTLGRQTHTTSATLTIFRKRGYQIERFKKDGKATSYFIESNKP